MENVSLGKYKIAVTQLLNGATCAGTITPYIKDLLSYLSDKTGVCADFDMNDWDDAKTAKGVAISPVQAAKCLQETLRSQKFMQGVKRAIEDRLNCSDDNIHVLYAGTGPYATLLLPLLCVLKLDRVKATLIDIHPENIDAVKTLINHFDVTNNNTDVVCADATEWQATEPQVFDIIISETMTALLKREPQVFIFAHLCQYLAASGTLIPQDISLRAWLTPSQPLIPVEDGDKTDILLKEFYSLNIEEAKRLSAGDRSSFKGSIMLPADLKPNYILKLTTDIQVYKHHKLTENQSSLNIPLKMLPHDAEFRGGEVIHYEYVTPQCADFVFKFPIKEIIKHKDELAKFSEINRLGIPGIKRMFERAQASKAGLTFSIDDKEWASWTALLDSLSLPYDETTAALYQSQRIEEFEHWLTTHSKLTLS